MKHELLQEGENKPAQSYPIEQGANDNLFFFFQAPSAICSPFTKSVIYMFPQFEMKKELVPVLTPFILFFLTKAPSSHRSVG
jgi:hypothetical protein